LKYFIQELQDDEGLQKTAGIKARDDVDNILASMGYMPLRIVVDQNKRKEAGSLESLKIHYEIGRIWKEALQDLGEGDSLVIQFPVSSHSVMIARQVRRCQKRGARIILLVHDLETLRVLTRDDIKPWVRARILMEEGDLLKRADCIIAHNRHMRKKLMEMGYRGERIINLKIFDYLIPGADQGRSLDRERTKDMPLIIAGALLRHKAGYIYELPADLTFNLYGKGYEEEGKKNICYHGALMPDDLPFELEGSFGLVWDGNTSSTCATGYGEYLKINNPHKTSLYLASQIPVIIWKEAALAEFVEHYGCGFAVDSLHEIPERIAAMTETEYQEMLKNCRKMSERLRAGWYTRKAVEEADPQ
jgi:glycosyltransferase involved in cell wall biosynthesis